MAIDLIKRNQCQNFIIVEKSSSVGGTWHDNKYPGCCCDVWSMLYSYSFEQNPDWTREYPGQEEILVRVLLQTPLLNIWTSANICVRTTFAT
jgi:cation diffusion facilitator CzcD-associated flavoprotein CzcO